MADNNLDPQAEAGSSATPSWKEALSATVSESVSSAAEDVEDSDSPASDMDADDGSGADDPALDPAGDATDEDADDQGDTGSVVWDGKSDSAPPEIKAYAAAIAAEAVKKRDADMQRGVQKLLNERAELISRIEQLQAGAHQPPPQSGPPKPPAEGAGADEWDAYDEKRTAWLVNETIGQMIKSGAILTPDQVRPIQEQVAYASSQAEQASRLRHIAGLPGCSDEIMARMADLAKNDENIYGLLTTNKGSETVFNIAKAQLEYEGKLAKVGAQTEQQARHGAGAGKSAIPRPGGVRKEGARAGRPKESFRSVAERLEYEIDQARKG